MTESDHMPDCPVWVPQGARPNAERERCTVVGPHDQHQGRDLEPSSPERAERVRQALASQRPSATVVTTTTAYSAPCSTCGEPFTPVRRGECSRCGSDAGSAVEAALTRAVAAEADNLDGWETTAAVLAFEVVRLRRTTDPAQIARAGALANVRTPPGRAT